jgi:hypothetical protein
MLMAIDACAGILHLHKEGVIHRGEMMTKTTVETSFNTLCLA